MNGDKRWVFKRCAYKIHFGKSGHIFARHGILNAIVAGNMPIVGHLNSFPLSGISKLPHQVQSSYPQSNGLVKRNVQTIKSLFKKAHDEGSDEEMALLEFCNTHVAGIQESLA